MSWPVAWTLIPREFFDVKMNIKAVKKWFENLKIPDEIFRVDATWRCAERQSGGRFNGWWAHQSAHLIGSPSNARKRTFSFIRRRRLATHGERVTLRPSKHKKRESYFWFFFFFFEKHFRRQRHLATAWSRPMFIHFLSFKLNFLWLGSNISFGSCREEECFVMQSETTKKKWFARREECLEYFPSDRNCRLFVLVSCNGNIFHFGISRSGGAAVSSGGVCGGFFFFSCIFYFLLPAIGQGRSRQTPATTSDDDRPSSNRLNNFISENFFRRSMNILQMPARRLRKKEIIDVLKLAPPDGSIWLWAPKFFPVNFVRFRRMAGESRRFSPVEIRRWVRYGRESYFGGRGVGGWGGLEVISLPNENNWLKYRVWCGHEREREKRRGEKEKGWRIVRTEKREKGMPSVQVGRQVKGKGRDFLLRCQG